MSKYDAENVLADVKALLVSNLNAAIAAVEAEKIAQGLPSTGLVAVDSTKGYFQQSWSDKILNINPAIFFGIENIAATGVGPATSQTYKVFIEVILVDSGQDALGNFRILRYTRAIKDVLEANWDQLSGSEKTKIETVIPASFKIDMNSSEEIKVGGVSLITALA